MVSDDPGSEGRPLESYLFECFNNLGARLRNMWRKEKVTGPECGSGGVLILTSWNLRLRQLKVSPLPLNLLTKLKVSDSL